MTLYQTLQDYIAEDVDVRRPDSQPLVNISIAEFLIFVVLRARLVGGYLARRADDFRIKARRHTDSLREHRRYTRTRPSARL